MCECLRAFVFTYQRLHFYSFHSISLCLSFELNFFHSWRVNCATIILNEWIAKRQIGINNNGMNSERSFEQRDRERQREVGRAKRRVLGHHLNKKWNSVYAHSLWRRLKYFPFEWIVCWVWFDSFLSFFILYLLCQCSCYGCCLSSIEITFRSFATVFLCTCIVFTEISSYGGDCFYHDEQMKYKM